MRYDYTQSPHLSIVGTHALCNASNSILFRIYPNILLSYCCLQMWFYHVQKFHLQSHFQFLLNEWYSPYCQQATGPVMN